LPYQFIVSMSGLGLREGLRSVPGSDTKLPNISLLSGHS
jgi:hypothetical protein